MWCNLSYRSQDLRCHIVAAVVCVREKHESSKIFLFVANLCWLIFFSMDHVCLVLCVASIDVDFKTFVPCICIEANQLVFYAPNTWRKMSLTALFPYFYHEYQFACVVEISLFFCWKIRFFAKNVHRASWQKKITESEKIWRKWSISKQNIKKNKRSSSCTKLKTSKIQLFLVSVTMSETTRQWLLICCVFWHKNARFFSKNCPYDLNGVFFLLFTKKM